MRILTLNVNCFRGDKNIKTNIDNFLELLRSINLSDDDIFVIQEIPYELWNKSEEKFLESYEIIHTKIIQEKKNDNNFKPIFCTIAIVTKNSNWSTCDRDSYIFNYNEKFDYYNRVIEVEYNNDNVSFSLLGVHMSAENDDKRTMWDMLLDSVVRRNKIPEEKKFHHIENVTFIVGDFNAYEIRGDMKDNPKQLREKGYNPVIPNNILTFDGGTSIDNIYLHERFIANNIETKVINTEEIKLSDSTKKFITDHRLIEVKIDLNNKVSNRIK